MLSEEDKIALVQKFALEDRPSGDMFRLQTAIEVAVGKLDKLAQLGPSTVKLYNRFMRALADDLASEVGKRMQRHGRHRLN